MINVRNIAGGLEGQYDSFESYINSDDYSDYYDVFIATNNGERALTHEESEELKDLLDAKDEELF